jgi:phasin family protein
MTQKSAPSKSVAKAAATAGRVVATSIPNPAAPVRSVSPITPKEKPMSKASSSNSNTPFFAISAEEIAAITKQNSDAFMKSAQTWTSGLTQLSQTMAQFSQNLMQMSVAACQAASSARTLKDVAELQSDYAKTCTDALVENGTRITEMALKIANDASAPISQRANETMQQFTQRTAA